MRRSFLSIVLCATGCATAGSNLQAEEPEAAASLEAFTRDIFTHLDSGDVDFIIDTACPEAVAWDTDMQMKPVSAVGKEQVTAMLRSYSDMVKQGTTIKSDVKDINCRGNKLFGACTVEFDQTATQNGQVMGPMKVRATLAALNHKDKWIWTYWHASARPDDALAAPVPAEPAAAPVSPPTDTAPAVAAPTAPATPAAPAVPPAPGAAPVPAPAK